MSTARIALEHRMSSDYREHRDDPAFYVLDDRSKDTWVASVSRDGRKIDIYCQGDMKVYWYEDSNDPHAGIAPEVMRDTNALFDHGIMSDEDLRRLDDEERLVWQNNSWFDLYGHTHVGHSRERHMDVVTDSLREAVRQATILLDDDSRWQS